MANPVPLEAAESIAAAVATLPFVDGLDEGRFGEVALMYPRTRVPGLRWADGRLEVHVRLRVDPREPAPLSDAAGVIRDTAVNLYVGAPDAGAPPVDVVIADVAGPGDSAAMDVVVASPGPGGASYGKAE